MADFSQDKTRREGAPDATDSGEASTSYPSASYSLEAEWQEAEAVLSNASVEPQAAIADNSEPIPSIANAVYDPSTPRVTVETAFLASAASLIWLINFYFPMGPVLRVFFPIPIALIYLRWSNRAAWMGTLVTGLLLSVLMGPVRSVQYIMPFGLLGMLLGMFWRRRAAWAISVPMGALLGAIGFFFRLWFVSVLLGDDLWLYATNQITDLLGWVFTKLGWLVQPSLAQVQGALVLLVLLNNLVYLFVVHLVAWFLLDRLGNPIPRPPKWVQTLMDYE
jgi:uncharacterized protein YybS (DUF2232 family)